MYLINTNVISELSKPTHRINNGVIEFFNHVKRAKQDIFLSVITIGELKRGATLTRHQGNPEKADQLDVWIKKLLAQYQYVIIDVNLNIIDLWASLCVSNHRNSFDKLIAATALIHDLTLVTRNTSDCVSTNVQLINPFSQ